MKSTDGGIFHEPDDSVESAYNMGHGVEKPGFFSKSGSLRGKNKFVHAKEVIQFCHRNKYFTQAEYYKFGLGNRDRTEDERARAFVGMFRTLALEQSLNSSEALGSAILRHKLLAEDAFQRSGLPSLGILAVYRSPLACLAARALTAQADLVAFLRRADIYPVFGKPVSSYGSLGALSLEGLEPGGDQVRMVDGRVFDVPAIAAAITNRFPGGYLFQRRLRQPEEVRRLSGDTASTVRIVTLWGSEGPSVAWALWRLASPDSVADNSWRPGITFCLIDPESGRIRRAVRDAPDGVAEVRRHGGSATELPGLQVPSWSEIRDLAFAAAAEFTDLTMIGWDIGIGEDGPVLIEGNTLPSTLRYQVTSGEGLLTPEFEARVKDARRTAVERGCAPPPPRPKSSRRRRGRDFIRRLDVWNLVRTDRSTR